VSTRARLILFAVVTAACAAAAVVSMAKSVDDERSAGGAASASARPAADLLAHSIAEHRPVLVMRSLDRSRYGYLAVATLDARADRRTTSIRCDRVHFAGGSGICLRRDTGLLNESSVELLDAHLKTRATLEVPGVPSRARVSPDGRLASVTTFVTGHSYATPGQFSTATTLIDVARGKEIGNLEDFETTADGRRVTERDRNFWGTTFARDGHSFYATLATGDGTHLIRGDVRTRRARVIHDNVECPSLSPDGTRIGYKKLVSSGAGSPKLWHFTVLDLKTMRETPLAEPAPHDDQLEWLDDDRVLYGNGEETWTVPADGSGTPARYLAAANSPAVVR
jgi:hypothetical protein